MISPTLKLALKPPPKKFKNPKNTQELNQNIAKQTTPPPKKPMDFNLGALKLLSHQLKQAKQTSSKPSSYTLGGGVLFQRAWLQGVLVSIINPDIDNDEQNNNSSGLLPRFLVDDGTGIIELLFNNKDLFAHTNWEIGMYVMVVGSYIARADEFPLIKVFFRVFFFLVV
ncbi:hypothetical protein RND81_11G108900 [Saponaria officinalis]|uniref:OB domain-containing protein n=1 Tax=Saponaria officinalis TaxID=3572 RepID=A0AAW1HM75_SAPOF